MFLKYWLWLTTRKGLGRKGAMAVLRHFGSPKEAYFADAQSYSQINGLTGVKALEDKSLTEAEEILRVCYQKNIHILTCQDAAYPERLRNLDDAPILLYYQGMMPAIDTEPVIAMVGTRRASAYGLLQAKQLGYQMGKLGAIVVSGGAAGIDTMCLKGALTAGRPVIAVLGCGLDITYPASNHSLFEDIRYHGCLISEYPPGTPALPEHFPVRNRIVSGLSLGVVVVEAPKRSGALITANRALEQGRDVFTLPANVGTQTCAGNIQLLKDGAIVIEDGWDVMREYVNLYPQIIKTQKVPIPMSLNAEEQPKSNGKQTEGSRKRSCVVATEQTHPEKTDRKDVDKLQGKAYIDVQEILPQLDETQRTLVQLLEKESAHIDDLIDQSGMQAGAVLAAMTLLEVKGYVKRLPARRFSLAEK